MAKKSKRPKRNVTKKVKSGTGKKNSNKRRFSGKVSTKRNTKGKKSKKLVRLVKKTVRSNPKRKTVVRTSKRKKKNSVPGYHAGKSQDARQYTFRFPDGMAENKKVAVLRSWDAKPLDYFITANRVTNTKQGRIFRLTPTVPVSDYTRGSMKPQGVWVKLVKRKPRDLSGEVFFTSAMSPESMEVNRVNTKAFSVGVLEKYYTDFVGKVKEKQQIQDNEDQDEDQDETKLKGSDPDDMDGKPLKVVAVIYHFIY